MDTNRKRYCFIFKKVAAYKNTLEEYILNESFSRTLYGWTIQSENSTWLNEYRQKEPLFEIDNPICKHFVIMSEDDVLEILCPSFPDIKEIESAKVDEELPGKSIILFHPEDRKAIEYYKDCLENRILIINPP